MPNTKFAKKPLRPADERNESPFSANGSTHSAVKKLPGRSPRKLTIRDVADGAIGEAITLKFGSVELQTTRDPKAFADNVKAGQEALRRAKDALVTPGVELKMLRSIPRYSADPSNPSLLVRELRGKRQIGKLVNGKFIAA